MSESRTDAHRRSRVQRLLYAFLWVFAIFFLSLVYRLRRRHIDRFPAAGPLLIASNHHSHFDPPLISLCTSRRSLTYLARASLFRNRVFGWGIGALGAISIEDNSGDIGAIRAVLAALDRGEAVLLFPEGSRTFDGSMQDFKRGISLILKRSKCPVLPVAIEGAYDAFPRQNKLPHLWGKRISVMIGTPIDHDELMANGPQAALKRLATEIDTMRLELRSQLRSATAGRYPAHGVSDHAASS